MSKCSPNCMYFNPNPSQIIKSEYKHDILFRTSVFLCDYDDHRIESYEECNHFRLRECIKVG